MKNLWTEILQMLKGSPKDVRIIGGVGKVWDVCGNNSEAEKYGTFFKRADAYDFLFYLAAEKHLW